jgi:carboxymethylenebutenolidase
MKGCVMYYGTPEKDKEKMAKIQCDVLGIFGTQDRGIPNETVDAFAASMKEAGKSFTLVRYDAVHAFANPSNPGYNKEFGEDAFQKSIAFLKARMK